MGAFRAYGETSLHATTYSTCIFISMYTALIYLGLQSIEQSTRWTEAKDVGLVS